MNLLNKSQVLALLAREAVFISTEDIVPVYRAAALFGEDAVAFARSANDRKPGCYFNGYGIMGYTLDYLTLSGFQVAASYYNVRQIAKEAQS